MNMADAVEILMSNYMWLIAVVAFTLTLFIIITYLAAKVFKLPEWEAYLSIELTELFKSLLIVVFAIGFFQGSSLFIEIITDTPQTTTAPREAAIYLQGLLEEQVLPGISDTFKVQVCLSIMNMIHRRIGEFVLTVSYKVFPGVDSMIAVTNVVGYGLLAVFGSIYAQILAMQFIDVFAINLFLPAGIILRFIPPTRDAGVFLIALAIGIQAVFPATYLINKQVLETIDFPKYETPYSLLQLCGTQFIFFGILGNFISSISGTFGMAFNSIFSELGLNFLNSLYFTSILKNMAPLSLPAFFLPAFSTTITFAFINALTKFMLSKM